MMAFPGMLVEAAKQAGMKCPKDPDNENWSADEYPHFSVFCQLQLGRCIQWGEHWDNAKIIAAVPENKIRKMTLPQFLAAGLRWQS